MTWYLGITTSRMIPPFPGADRIRGEAAVEKQLQAIGIECFVPTRTVFKRQGKNRYAEPVVEYMCPNYIFANIPADQYADAVAVRGISRTLMMVPAVEVKRHLRPFIARVAADQEEALRIIESGDRREMSTYQPGDALEIIAGPFAGFMLQFKAMLERSGDPFPMVEGEVEIFGRDTPVRLDPVDVRRVG
jgi:transcriptional antiterminator NusG